jgi:hypothetical protein
MPTSTYCLLSMEAIQKLICNLSFWHLATRLPKRSLWETADPSSDGWYLEVNGKGLTETGSLQMVFNHLTLEVIIKNNQANK